MQSRNIRFQISDIRFQIPTPGREADFFGRFQISDLRSPRGTRAETSKRSRILNTQNTFQDLITDFCATQISDFRSQNWPDFRFQISDFVFQIPERRVRPGRDFRFQKTDFKEPGEIPQVSDFRFQIPHLSGAGRCGISTADFRMQNSDTRHQEISVRGP